MKPTTTTTTTTTTLRRPRPPRSGDVSAVLAYLRSLEVYATTLEQRVEVLEGRIAALLDVEVSA